jgi:hypothetical protein
MAQSTRRRCPSANAQKRPQRARNQPQLAVFLFLIEGIDVRRQGILPGSRSGEAAYLPAPPFMEQREMLS